MTTPLDNIQQQLDPLRTKLLTHPVYRRIDNLDALRLFMEHHIFAVWDFMSLLKILQQRLTSVTVPWVPVKSSLGTRLVNEIVLGEESDEDGRGGFASHFTLYHQAMRQIGADTTAIDAMIRALQEGATLEQALTASKPPESVGRFVERTFEIIRSENVCGIASAFLFGREDLLPGLFQRIVDELNVEASGGLDAFKYYLVRHIELDGEQHGAMAGQLLNELCGNDAQNWKSAECAALQALEARCELWDGINAKIAAAAAKRASA